MEGLMEDFRRIAAMKMVGAGARPKYQEVMDIMYQIHCFSIWCGRARAFLVENQSPNLLLLVKKTEGTVRRDLPRIAEVYQKLVRDSFV